MSDAMDVDFEPLEIRFHPGKLSDMAGVSLASALLRYRITYVRRNDGKGADINALDLARVPVPTSLRKTLEDLYCKVEKSWMSWWFYHQKHVFLKQPSHDSMIDWLDQMVWLPDGTINYERTAKEILFGDKLTKVQKFQLACTYCFIDDANRLEETLTREEIRYATLECEFDEFNRGFWNYWHGRMVLLSPYGTRRESSPDEFFSFLLHLRDNSNTLKCYDEWSAIEYFFGLSRKEDFWTKVRTIISMGRPRVIFNILVKMTAYELNSMINEKRFNVVQALLGKQNYDYTILIWKHMVRFISDAVLADTIRYVNDYHFERKYVDSLLLEMWLCISERQKKYIINEYVCDFTINKPSWHEIKNFPPNFPLILDFLSHCDLERKYKYWSDNWPYLVINQLGSENRNIIDRIMKLCLVDDHTIDDFKKTKMIDYGRIAKYCHHLICEDRIPEIQSYLEFCTSDSQVIRDLKKEIITSISNSTIFNILFYGSDKEIGDFFQYLDDIFTENETKQFLNNIVTLPSTLEQFCSMIFRTTSEKLENMIELLEKYVSSEEDLFKAKRYIFNSCYGRSDISIFLDLIKWCLNVDKLVTENFKGLPSSHQVMLNENMITNNELLNDGQMRNSGHYIFDVFMSPYHHRYVIN